MNQNQKSGKIKRGINGPVSGTIGGVVIQKNGRIRCLVLKKTKSGAKKG